MIFEFNQRTNDPKAKLPMSLDMSRVEAVMDEARWTCIVTGTDTYYVTEDYEFVVAAWLRARRDA